MSSDPDERGTFLSWAVFCAVFIIGCLMPFFVLVPRMVP